MQKTGVVIADVNAILTHIAEMSIRTKIATKMGFLDPNALAALGSASVIPPAKIETRIATTHSRITAILVSALESSFSQITRSALFMV